MLSGRLLRIVLVCMIALNLSIIAASAAAPPDDESQCIAGCEGSTIVICGGHSAGNNGYCCAVDGAGCCTSTGCQWCPDFVGPFCF